MAKHAVDCYEIARLVVQDCGMDQHLLLAFTGFAAATLFTPGPNNIMLMASGANFGVRRSVPHLLGVALGFPAMVAALALGIDRLFAVVPALVPLMKVASVAYLLWLAWKIARAAAPGEGRAGAQPLSFGQAAGFQWVNPKAWAMGLGALTVYAPGLGGSVWIVALFALIGIPSALVWTGMGQGLRGWLGQGRRLRVFNGTMAALMVLSVLPML